MVPMPADIDPQPAVLAAADPAARLAGVRVAIVTGNYNYVKEGANQALNRLAAHLVARTGAQIRAYSPVTATPAFDPVGTIVPIRSIAAPGRPEFRIAMGLPRAARADMAAFAPDIVHIATPDWLGVQAQRFARARGFPVVASLHTHFERYCDYYGLGMLRPAVEAHLRRFYRRSDRVLVPTGAVLDDMAAAQGRDRLAIWSRGVDTALFDPAHRSQAWRQRHGIGDDRIAILFFGRIVLEKGLDRFAETVALLRTLGHAVQPVIVGEGPARARLQAALPDAVFTGHLVDESLAVAVASCDMMINPSVTETFGNVSLEAMASGLAVVAARVPSSANLIDHGVSGLIADGHDAIAMAAQAQRAIVDPALRQRLGSAARAAAMGRGWDSVLDTVLDSYATVLGRGGAA